MSLLWDWNVFEKTRKRRWHNITRVRGINWLCFFRKMCFDLDVVHFVFWKNVSKLIDNGINHKCEKFYFSESSILNLTFFSIVFFFALMFKMLLKLFELKKKKMDNDFQNYELNSNSSFSKKNFFLPFHYSVFCEFEM